ncbi:metallophosphoesterase [Laceyella putida]|uniref:Metallophosphoesterase n=1 Tax=Laceyella putida TaxID=110101 RepID=A0ABW2RGC3_9BACL
MPPTQPSAKQAEPRFNRRQFLKLSLAALCLGPPLYAGLLERNWIETIHHTISSPRVPAAFDGIRIVQISDIHLGHYFDLDRLETVIRQIQTFQPDLLCFTGDLIDRHLSQVEAKEVARLFRRLAPPLGKFATLGNHDYWGDVALVKEALTHGGFHVLVNQVHPLTRGKGTLYVSGLDDLLNGQPDLAAVLSQLPSTTEVYHLCLAHEPDMAVLHHSAPIDLQLSGHSHGGQIRLPFLGALAIPEGGKRYPAGLYSLNERFTLYTNRGLGTTILPFRFLCRPEITVLELRRESSSKKA